LAITGHFGAGLPLLLAVLVLSSACSPQQGGAPATSAPSPTLVTLGKLTLSATTCELEAGAAFASGRVTFLATNRGSALATFVINRLLDGHTFAEARAHVENERRLADAGEPFVGPPAFFQSQGSFAVNPGETTTPTLTLLPGTYEITCLARHPRDGQLRVVAAAGPLEVK
jgi:hypothetical protein